MLRYRLDDLGWYQFECMIQSLLKSSLGMGIESWAGRGDQGRDAFFKGQLEFPIKGQLQNGPFIFQVKFVEEANAAGANPRSRLLSAIDSEIKRIKVKRTLNVRKAIYSLLTNAFLSPEIRTEIAKKINDEFPLLDVYIMGGQDVCDLLDNSPNIRISFPQILSLRDLDSLLNDVIARPIIERSRGMIEESREFSLIFYPTNAYSETIQKLTVINFAVLESPPEVGKTAIARMVGLSKLSIGWDAYECLRPNDFFQLLSNERPQIFIADDAFGSTEYDPARSSEWSLNLDRILRRLDHKHWLIWTARKHILEIALQRMRLQGKGEKFPEPGSIIIDAGNLTKIEKAMILYRHAKAAGFEKTSRDFLKKYAQVIVSDRYFTPERIRRFITISFPNLIDDFNNEIISLDTLNTLITREIKEPTRSLTQAFECLSEAHKKLLISRLDLDESEIITDPEEISLSFERHKPQATDKTYEQLERDLSSSFLKEINSASLLWYRGGWVHPSMRDLVIMYLINNKNCRTDFLGKCSIGGISLAFSIGGGSEGTRIFPLIIDNDDKLIIHRRIKELIMDINTKELTKLLETINDAKTKSSELEDIEINYFINEIFEIAIDELLSRWRNTDSIIEIELLKIYYDIINKSISYRPPAPLKCTWDDCFGTLIAASNNLEDYVETQDCFELNHFLDIIELINLEDPRFLRYVDFPNCFTNLATDYIIACISYAQSDYTISSEGTSNYDLYSSEAAKFTDLHEMAERIINLNLNLELGRTPEEALQIIANAASEWEEKAREEYEPEPDYDDDRISRDADYIDVDSLFSDL